MLALGIAIACCLFVLGIASCCALFILSTAFFSVPLVILIAIGVWLVLGIVIWGVVGIRNNYVACFFHLKHSYLGR